MSEHDESTGMVAVEDIDDNVRESEADVVPSAHKERIRP